MQRKRTFEINPGYVSSLLHKMVYTRRLWLSYVHRNPGLSASDTHIMYSQKVTYSENFYIFAIHKG